MTYGSSLTDCLWLQDTAKEIDPRCDRDAELASKLQREEHEAYLKMHPEGPESSQRRSDPAAEDSDSGEEGLGPSEPHAAEYNPEEDHKSKSRCNPPQLSAPSTF